jgi:dTDP-4-amino-4,6-dideoxygalactose transaminase
MGLPCDLDALVAIATRHGLPLVEDAACAAGSDVLLDGRWQRVGSPRGDVCCFSFHPRKLLTTGDGGMLTTRRADLDHAFRLGRQHGMSVSDRARHASPHVVDEAHVTLGYNYRMTDVQAAIGRVQLARLPLILERRRRLAGRYRTLLTSLPVAVPAVPHWAHPNWQSFWIELPAGCDRPALMQQLLDEGIATRRGIRCAHLEPAYATEPWKAGPGGLTESERASDRSLVLPLYPQMTDAEQDEVAAGLAAALTGVAIE